MDYYNNYYPDYMYHYGVKGMKWGVRKKSSGTSSSSGSSTAKKVSAKMGKAVTKRVEKSRVKAEAKRKSYQRTTEMFGVGGAAIRSYAEYQGKYIAKSFATHFINESANAFISSNVGRYRVNRGVDLVRRAAINGLSISGQIDQIQAFANVGRAYMYQVNKNTK